MPRPRLVGLNLWGAKFGSVARNAPICCLSPEGYWWQTQILTRCSSPVRSTRWPGFKPRFRILFVASCIGSLHCGQASGGAGSVTLRG